MNSMTMVRKLEAARRLRARLKVEAAEAWAAYYRACDKAEDGAPDPVTGGIPADVLANIERLGAWAEAVEAEYRKAYRLEGMLAAAILWPEKATESMEDYRDLFTPMVAQLEAV